MSSRTGYSDGDEPPEEPGAADAAGERADELMESLAMIVAADGPGTLDALRAGDAELADLAARFASVYWLRPVFDYYRGRVRLELWERLDDPADLETACDLLLLAVGNMPEPDEEVVFFALEAAWDSNRRVPSARARDAFITWGTWLLDRLSAKPGDPVDVDPVELRLHIAAMLIDRADAGDGDRLADLDAARELLLAAIEGMPEPEEDVVIALLRTTWDRYLEAPSVPARDVSITWGTWLLDRLSAKPDILPDDDDDDDDDVVLLREQVAFALNDRADAGDGDRVADLDAAIAHYEALLPARPAGQPDRAELLAFLVHAYWDRIAAGESQDELVDRLTRHAHEAWTAPGLPGDARGLVGLCLALGLLEQFSRPGPLPAVALLDLGIDALSQVLPELLEEPDVALVAETVLGVLLVSKGQVTGDAASLAKAEPHLRQAASRLRAGDPDWSFVTRLLGIAESALAAAGLGADHADRAIGLLRAAAEHPPADQEQAALVDQLLGTVLFTRMAGQRNPDADEGIRYLIAAFQKAPAGSPARLQTAWNLCSVLTGRFFVAGSRQDLEAAQFYLGRLEETGPAGLSGPLAETMPDADLILAAVRGQIEVARGVADADLGPLRAGIESLRAAVRAAGPGHPLVGRLRSDLGLALLMGFDHGREDPANLREGIAELEAAIELLPPGNTMRDITLFRAAAAQAFLGVATLDPGPLREGAARMRQVRADWAGGVGDPLRVTAMLAVMHAELHRMSGGAADLAAARDWYATATAEFERQPGHPQHGTLLIGLARLERRAGARQSAVQAGLAALRARARDVLLQAGPAHGLATARIAAAEAAEVAGWCLADESSPLAAPAVEALELGRGLVLHAATSTADLPELLDAADRPDLASEWRHLADGRETDEPWGDAVAGLGQAVNLLDAESLAAPSDLRERTLGVLGDEALITPPTYREIAAAAARNGADALVYLLPPAGDGPGSALLVPAAGGEPRAVPLPLLSPEHSGPLDEFAAAQASLLAAASAPGGGDGQADADGALRPADNMEIMVRWGKALGQLCDWAWTAVVGPLLAEVPRAEPAAPPRLVLVPTGRLGMVPWHAARRPVPETRWRYAIADAVFSYAASGRQLAEVSRRPALPLTDDPVIVAPREEELAAGLAEASAVRGIYPNARYFGYAGEKPPDGPAMPENVLGALPAKGYAGASVLHLVCHGMATSAGADASYLVLEKGRRLAVREILRQANGRPAGSPGGIVVLAACRTDLTAADHDEALTLSTAFLAAGAVTAVGSRWEIPDAPSAVLMFMFHHYLAAGRQPSDALRAAQLWMLDRDREPPPSMPPALRGHRALTGVMAWGGLTHQGR